MAPQPERERAVGGRILGSRVGELRLERGPELLLSLKPGHGQGIGAPGSPGESWGEKVRPGVKKPTGQLP